MSTSSQPIAYFSVEEACRVSSLGKTFIYGRIADGSLQIRKVGRRTLIPAESLRRLCEGEAA